MDIKRKVELAKQAVTVIATHDDADLAVRAAALDALAQHIEAVRDDAKTRVAAKIAEQVGAEA